MFHVRGNRHFELTGDKTLTENASDRRLGVQSFTLSWKNLSCFIEAGIVIKIKRQETESLKIYRLT